MAYNPNNANGQAIMANSAPVVIASDQSALPISQVDTLGTGTISATDSLAGIPQGNGTLISTAPTASSFVALAIPGGSSQVDIMIAGAATGTYYFEHSLDSTTGSDGSWVATNFRQTGLVNTVLGFSTKVTGIFRGNSAGFKYVRVRNVGGTSPNNAVTIRETNGSGTAFLNASLPTGTNTIGATYLDPNIVSSVANPDAKALLENIQTLIQLQIDAVSRDNTFRQLDNRGREVMTLGNPRGMILSQVTTISATTAETTIVTGTDPGVSNDILAILVTNTSTSTVCRVDFRDSTGGIIRAVVQSVGGTPTNGVSLGGWLLPQQVKGGNWTATCGTSTTDIRITVLYTQNS